jgi:acyl-CoA thioesterase
MNDDEIRDSIDISLRDRIFEKVKRVHNAPYARLNDIDVVSVKEDEIRTKMPLDRNKENSIGFAHGAAIFAIADHTFAFAANLSDEIQIAISSDIVFHKPGVGRELTAVSSKISETRSLSTHMVMVYCDGKHIATAKFMGFKMKDRNIR